MNLLLNYPARSTSSGAIPIQRGARNRHLSPEAGARLSEFTAGRVCARPGEKPELLFPAQLPEGHILVGRLHDGGGRPHVSGEYGIGQNSRRGKRLAGPDPRYEAVQVYVCWRIVRDDGQLGRLLHFDANGSSAKG